MKNTLSAIIALVVASAPIVARPSQTDLELQARATASYNLKTVLASTVKVEVLDGVLTLSGYVADEHLSILAENTVKGLPGVKQVRNQVSTMQNVDVLSEGVIITRARVSLLMKSDLAGADPQISVKKGVVTVTGSAISDAQKALITQHVGQIEGVKSVQNQLVVRASAAQSVSNVIDDESITALVIFALITDSATASLATIPTTKNGVVLLHHSGGSDAQVEYASKLISGLRGVKSVVRKTS